MNANFISLMSMQGLILLYIIGTALICVSSIAIVLLTRSDMIKPDGVIEEAIEEVIHEHTYLDLDLSPGDEHQ